MTYFVVISEEAIMKGQGDGYVPPLYVPLGQSDAAIEDFDSAASSGNENRDGDAPSSRRVVAQDPTQWSSGICACCDDMQSCMLLSAL